MNAYAWLSLAASLVTVFLGLFVYSINRKKLLNKLFLLTALAGLYWTFTEFMMWQSSNAVTADFWNDLGFLWPFFVVLVIHFSLVFTESSWLKNKFTYLALYAPAVFFAVIDYSTELINGEPVLQYWGYEDTSPATLMFTISNIWVSLLPVLALLVCVVFYFRTKDETKKKRSKFVTLGFAIPIVTYLVTNVGFPFLSIDIPNLGHFATLFFGIFVAYAMMKYDLFTFDAALAAENIITTMPDSLILTDMKAKMQKVNHRIVNFLGYKEAELIGKSIIELSSEKAHFKDVLEQLTKERVIQNHELRFESKYGETKYVLFSGSVVKSKTLRDVGLTCVIRDITERKNLEERVLKSERLASIGELAGQIGHDLRNPLTGIKGAAYYLEKKGTSLSEIDRKNTFAIINNAVDDCNRIVSGLSDYSTDLRLEITACTPRFLFDSALKKVNIPSRIRLVDQVSDEPQLSVDAGKMESVLVNIITNAVEAIPGEGTLQVLSRQHDSEVIFTIVDSGVGISQELMGRIFSPLVTTKAKGMGLGLAICKRVMEAHGGSISVESTVGKGTTFTVVFPSICVSGQSGNVCLSWGNCLHTATTSE